ncbi:MAG: CHAT domain-containing protein [bacterium]|nr:CHAT domain-containing protein [bacterium]
MIAVSLVLASLAACRHEPAATLLDPASKWPLRRALKGGEVHAFAIALEADQYVQALVDQQGVDLVVTLLDPRGQPLLEVDNPSGADGSYGPERVVWVAEGAGSYGLTVRGWDGEGVAGRYELTIEQLRTAGEVDRKRAAAERAMSEADALYYRTERKLRRQAINKYEEALAGFLALGDRSRQADALFRLGQTWEALSERRKALAVYERALELYEAFQNNDRQQALTLHNLCSIYNSVREMDKALGYCHRALPVWEQVADRRGQALTSNDLGFIYRRLGEGLQAVTLYDQALRLWRELGNRSEEAKTLHNRGRLYAALGKKEQAVADLHQALEIRRELGEPGPVASTLNSLGQLYDRDEETEKAYPFFQQALALGKTDRRRKAITLTGIARIHSQSDETEKALDYYRRAWEIFRAEADPTWEAHTLLSIGRLLVVEDDPQAALGYFRQALPLQERIRDRAGAAATLLGMASAERRRDNPQVARKKIEAALDIIEDLRTRASAAGVGRAYYFAIKQSYYDFYIDLLMELQHRSPSADHDAEALAASERARARSLLDILTEAGRDIQRGVDPALLEHERALERQINAKELRLVWLLENQMTEPRDLVEEVEREQRDLLREYEKVRERIRVSSPYYAALTQPRPLSAAEIQRQVLDSETLLLEYKLGEERSFLWAVTPEAITSFVLPGRDQIEQPARRAYDLVTRNQRQARQRVRKDLAGLSDLLLSSVAAQLSAKRRLLIVGDGALQYLPFGALPVPGEPEQAPALPLIAEHEIVTMPSASTLAMLRDQVAERPPAPKTLAVLADPVFGSDDPRLAGGRRAQSGRVPPAPPTGPSGERSADPGSYQRLIYSGREAETILALVPAESRFEALGFDASRDLVTSGELGRYRIVHFAAHGDLNAVHPELSRLVLSLVDREGKPRDGLLHAYEIYDLELAAELVVLSACQTALGPQIRGEGLVGLTRGFMHAGAARVVVSLWKVDDRATAELMERFYRHLLVKRLPPAAALREAQDSIRRESRWREPYYWAGFVLQGEWRDIRRRRD